MYSSRTSMTDMPEKKKPEQTDSITIEDVPNAKVADFETAISAAGTGKFQYLLIIAIIPASWASSVDTANMSMILASAEKDLGLSWLDKGLLNAIVYIGMVLSGFLWGYLADVKGRRKVILYGYMADGICNILAGFSQNFWTLVFFKFLSGLLVSGPHACLVAYCTEFYGDKGRAKIPILVGFSVQFGCVINAVLAWLVVPQSWSIVFWDGAFVYNSWRIFLSLCGVPTLIGILCLCFFPESPKFLMTQNRNEDALRVFRQIYSVNTGLPMDSYPICVVRDVNLNKTTAEQSTESEKDAKLSFNDGLRQMKAIFLRPHLMLILLLVTIQFGGMLKAIAFVVFTVLAEYNSLYLKSTLTYYFKNLNTFRLWQPQLFATIENFKNLNVNITNPTFCDILDISTSVDAQRAATITTQTMSENIVSESIYVDTVIVSATGSVFILFASVFVNFLEHKYLLLVSYGCAILCLISIVWATSTLTILVLTCLFIGLLSETFNVTLGATVLLFPTSLRAKAVSLEMMVGRIGSMLGNIVFPILLQYGCVAPIIYMSCFTLLCIILTCFLPSTRKHAV